MKYNPEYLKQMDIINSQLQQSNNILSIVNTGLGNKTISIPKAIELIKEAIQLDEETSCNNLKTFVSGWYGLVKEKIK